MCTQCRMKDQPAKLVGINRFRLVSIKMRVDVGRKRNAQRIVGMDADDARFIPNELV